MGSKVGGEEEVAVRGGGEMVGGGFDIVKTVEGVAMAVSEVQKVLRRNVVVVVVCALLTAVCRKVRCVTSRCHSRTQAAQLPLVQPKPQAARLSQPHGQTKSRERVSRS